MTSVLRWTTWIAIVTTLLVAPPRADGTEAPSGSPEEILAEAWQALTEGDPKRAVKLYRRADEEADGRCGQCLLGLATAFNQMGAFRDAEKAARRALEIASEPVERARALNQLGLSLYAAAASKPALYGDAEAAFRRVLEVSDGQATIALFNLAQVLLQLERDEEAVALLQQYLGAEPDGVHAAAARELVANPLRARKNLLPSFEIVTLDGSFLTSRDLAGQVLLIDFWATWCAPCVDAVPHLKSLHKRSTKRPFTLLSVGVDEEREKLDAFIAEHQMGWLHAWDANGEGMAELFRVDTYPTYLVISDEGEIVYRGSGWSWSVQSELDAHLFKAVRAAQKAAGR